MKTITLILVTVLLAACSSTPKKKGPEFSITGSGDPSVMWCDLDVNNCYAEAERICGTKGYTIVRDTRESGIVTAGRSGASTSRADDPFSNRRGVNTSAGMNRGGGNIMRFKCKSIK